MLTKTLDFILDVLKALIIPKLGAKSEDTIFELTKSDSTEYKKQKLEHNERMGRKKITGISNSWVQNEIIKICDNNTDVPSHNYFAPFV
ncbi:hypothetical protein XBO1_2520013 [Xenorhabdus bovienii str. oregonense]|uniref:Uncharacterized protein n=1 Tax=Xenorhabdus bovienii str. oregonense TaxID=1398202 RepID=A0A077NXZ6_XENBV|nr:hypothetical protein [Xenorhabdus bovienii]CDH07042.1 hypothetical protein XBO1_2520013 [Xenorhabdus bovienii str. oregonense]